VIDPGFDCAHRVVVDCNAIPEKFHKDFPCPKCWPGRFWEIRLEPFGPAIQFAKEERAFKNQRWYVWVLNQ